MLERGCLEMEGVGGKGALGLERGRARIGKGAVGLERAL